MIFSQLPRKNSNADVQGKYSDTYFRIDKNGYEAYGDWADDIRKAYTDEVEAIFLEQGWVIEGAVRDCSCATATKGKSSLYLHPQNFSGVCENAERELLFVAFQKAITFVCCSVDTYEEIFDMTDEQLMDVLIAKKAQIESELLEAFTTKRRNLYIVAHIDASIEIASQHSVKRLAIPDKPSFNGVALVTQNICLKYVSDIFQNLVDTGRIVTASTKSGTGYRTAKKDELKKVQNDGFAHQNTENIMGMDVAKA